MVVPGTPRKEIIDWNLLPGAIAFLAQYIHVSVPRLLRPLANMWEDNESVLENEVARGPKQTTSTILLPATFTSGVDRGIH